MCCPKCGETANEKVIKDPTFTGFWHGLDIHQMTADATGMDRSDAKSLNFAAVYLASAWKLEKTFGKYSVDEWDIFLNKFFQRYRGVKRWHVEMEDLMNSKRVVKDVFGRSRRISKREIKNAYKHSLNMFVNFPIQCSGAHYLSIAKRKIRQDLIDVGIWQEHIWLTNEVHDELVYECRSELVNEVAHIVLKNMRYAVQWDIPINAELKISDHWGCK
jgi:DNA polymerase-1